MRAAPLLLLLVPRASASGDESGLARWWNGDLKCSAMTRQGRNVSKCGASAHFAHLWYSGPAGNIRRRMNASWLGRFRERHGMRGCRFVDYGIGGGVLGEELLRRDGAAHYTGIDIANRSLAHASRRLRAAGLDRSRWRLLLTPQEFGPLQADYFFSLAVIQHFPSRAYTDDFFARLERSRIRTLVLQIKWSAPPAFLELDAAAGAAGFRRTAYERRVATATMLDAAYLRRALPSYDVVWQSTPERRVRRQEEVWVELARNGDAACAARPGCCAARSRDAG